MLGLFSAAALLCGLIVLAGVGARTLRTRMPLGRRADAQLEVIERVALAPKQGLALVRVGERRVLVSMGDGGVRTVLELGDQEAAPAASVVQPLRRHAFMLLLVCAGLAVAPVAARADAAADSAAAAAALVDEAAVEAAQAAAAAQAPGTRRPQQQSMPRIDVRLGGNDTSDLRVSGTVGSVIMIGLLAMLPAMLLLMTSFTRILIVLHFLKQALGTQTAPPGQLLAALSLMLTGFVMAPTLSRAHTEALQPWMDGTITEGEMLTAGVVPFREFMLAHTPERDLERFIEMANVEPPQTADDIPLAVLVSAFAVSELRAAFQMGFAIFLPFVVIDLVVSAVLTSMGMFMLPPTMIALPCKLLLFVLADGWALTVQSLVASFRIF